MDDDDQAVRVYEW